MASGVEKMGDSTKRMPPETKPARVTVFGGASIDRLARSAGPVVAGASNPGTIRIAAGGVGFNVAASLARLGVPTRLVAILGEDADGDGVIRDAQAAGVDIGATLRSRRAATATYQASLDERGELILGIADMAIYEDLDAAAVSPAIETDDAALWVIDANLPEPTLDYIVGEAARLRRRVAALAVSPAKAIRLAALIEDVTYLFANRREALAILERGAENGKPSPADLAAELAIRGTGVVITDSDGPIAAASGGETRSFAAFRAQVVSVNGGGDALAAGTLFGLAGGSTLFESVRFGLAAAAIAVESEDTVSPDLSAKRLTERLAAGGKTR
jgi:pseudouridine kinase